MTETTDNPNGVTPKPVTRAELISALTIASKVLFAYDVGALVRCYGGPEEGGWWYDWYEHVKSSRPMSHAQASELLLAKNEALPKKRRNRYSVLGGPDTVNLLEERGGENISREVPHYE